MHLEWQQVITQIVGFLIALWVLKKFAWRPLLGVLEERKEKIKSEFGKIEEDRKKAQILLEQYQEKLKEIDAEARVRIQEVVNEGRKIAAEIKQQAQAEAKEVLSKAQAEITRELAKAKVQLKNDIVSMALAATEKIIDEKLDEKKDRKLIADFIEELEIKK
ncbi:MAG TPA: F0F1 ATP synthase subunit B [candidate division Zixibacteria bacterium]|nr:F0F1 ATP synthase subunit B [candidate division Zixibacteria bacterium]